MSWYLWLSPLVLLLAAILIGWLVRRTMARSLQSARQRFMPQREHLEARFFHAASTTGKPRGLLWKDCEWSNEVRFARDRRSGELVALVAVTIQFEAIPGSDMEGLPAVGNLRNASAVFFYQRGRWQTTGKAVFNLNPEEAIAHFSKQYELIAGDTEGR